MANIWVGHGPPGPPGPPGESGLEPRPITFVIKKVIDIELKGLEQLGILDKVDHAKWAVLIVPASKGNGLF